MVEVDVQTVSIAIASASVVVGVVYYAFQIRNQNRMRQTDLLMRLYSTFTSREFEEAWYKVLCLEFKDYEDFVGKYGSVPSETSANIAFASVTSFFEGIGVLLYKKLVDIDLIWELFSPSITNTWQKCKPIVEGYRQQYGKEIPEAKNDLTWFEYLYNEVKKREQKGVDSG
jgi:hypothetical protein